MTVMTMNELTEFINSVKDTPTPESLNGLEERMDEIISVMISLAESAESARDIILKKTTEERFVQFMNSISKITVFGALVEEGEGMGLMMSMMSGELVGYTHSVILATIGALINEEIL